MQRNKTAPKKERPEKDKQTQKPPVGNRAAFNQLLDDAVLGVKKKG